MLKNKEVRRYILSGVIITAIVGVAAYFFKLPAFMAVVIEGVLLFFLWFVDMQRRYRHMQRMAQEIDLILHGRAAGMLSEYEEGDISILRNEIAKMTVMLRQQAEQLGDEKHKLADALADISHQIRTPLTSLNLMLEALKKEDDEEKKSRIIFDMRRQLERIDGLVVSLLKLAKMDAGTIKLQKSQVKLGELVKAALQPVEIMLELKEITTKIDVRGSFIGDKEWSSEALTNILKNCMEHTADGGTITVSGYENAVHTELVIEDSGSGIAADDIQHIFERFYRADPARSQGGYGLGLSIAKSIVDTHKGQISVSSSPETGTVFTVIFPKK